MLYLIGGASRSGKSWLARRLLEQHSTPYFSIDILMMGFANGWPAFGLDPETPNIQLGAKLWPIVRAMAVNILEEAAIHPKYLLEGVQLLPRHAAELVKAYTPQVKACFLGYTHIPPAEKLNAIRQAEADWANYYTPEQALSFLAGEVAYSRYLEQECTARDLPYFDVSEDLPKALQQALEYLIQS